MPEVTTEVSKNGDLNDLKKNKINMPADETDHVKRGTIGNILANVTVEPTIFIVMCVSVMYQLVTQNLYLEKACRVDLAYNSSLCDAISDRNSSLYTEQDEKNVQKVVSQTLAIKTTIQGLIPLCLLLFIGSWSDRHNKRKAVILLPILGELLSCSSVLVAAIYLTEIPTLYTALADALPLAMLGGWPCLFLGIYSYLGSVVSKETKTLRIGITTSFQMAGIIFGTILAGSLLEFMDFVHYYMMCCFAIVFALFLTALLVEETKSNDEFIEEKGFLRDFFDIRHFFESVKVGFKNDANKRRLKMIAIIAVSFCTMGPWNGEYNVTYLYTRYKFGWDILQFSFFSSMACIAQVVGSMVVLIIFSKLLKWKDASLGIMALTGSITASFIYAFAPNGTLFSLGPIFDCFSVAAQVAIRSQTAKIVPANELGQTNSIFGISEASLPLIFGPFYTLVYKYTIEVFAGSYFLISATLKFLGLLVFCWLYTETSKQ